MQAIVLCGGKGTRISTLYPDIPKALVPVLKKPFIEWQVKWLRKNGVDLIHLAAGHLAQKLIIWRDTSPLDGKITISTEPGPLGTAGGLKHIEDIITGDSFLVINGDTIPPALDLKMMEKYHLKTNHAITIAVTQTDNAERYGTVQLDNNDQITGFIEKGTNASGLINGGVYILNRRILASIASGKNISLETDLFPALAAKQEIGAFRFTPPLLDMGTPDGLKKMTDYFSRNLSFD